MTCTRAAWSNATRPSRVMPGFTAQACWLPAQIPSPLPAHYCPLPLTWPTAAAGADLVIEAVPDFLDVPDVSLAADLAKLAMPD